MVASPKKPKKQRRNRFVSKGGILPPAALVMHFSPDQWERFIEMACLHRPINGSRYVQINRLGNAGDAGRDIEARLIDTLLQDKWDLYQAKHYDHRLAPSDVFGELAKFFSNLAAGIFPMPRRYYFCSPQNAGPDLHDLFAKPDEFKTRFISDWSAGKTGLKDWGKELTPKVLKEVQQFDFGRIQECLVRDLIKWHATDQTVHFELFGIEPERGDDPAMPTVPTDDELVYIDELLRVYGEDRSEAITLAEVDVSKDYSEHFSASRTAFYCAEGLKRFSRDLYPEDEFGHLLTMVLAGIRPIVSSPKNRTGFDRLDRAVTAAAGLNVSESKLSPRVRGGDLPGTCHHLVNESKIRWVR
jgi:hypothetical protein